jgi:hypothetical protein
MTNDTKNIPNVVQTYPVPPIVNIALDTPNHLITRGAEKPGGVFSEVNLPTVSENVPQRDDKGRFLTGNNGGGRKKGKRNKLSELFLSTVIEDFAEHGAETLERLRNEDPGFYLKMIAVLVPKSLIEEMETAPDTDYANMTPDEISQLLEDIHRKRMIEKAIESVSK